MVGLCRIVAARVSGFRLLWRAAGFGVLLGDVWYRLWILNRIDPG